MKTFFDKSKLKKLLTTKVAQHRILEGILRSEKKKRKIITMKRLQEEKLMLQHLLYIRVKKISNTKQLTKWQGTIHAFQ